MKIGRWSTTAANNNNTPPDGWPEGQAPSTVNDCAREMMASIRTMINDLSFIDLAHSCSRTSAVTFTVPGDVTTFYDIGRRVKCFDASTFYGTVISASFTTNTGVTLRLDSGSLTTSLTSIAVSVLGNNNHAIPQQVYRQENYFDNPSLDIWQRATSFNYSGSAAGSVTADRWVFGLNATASVNVTRSERSAAGSNVPTLAQAGYLINSSICISVSAADAAIAASDYALLTQRIEGFTYRMFAQKPLTLGFWVNTNRTGTYCVSVRNGGGDRCHVQEYSVSSASTWEEKTFTIPEPPSAGTWDYSSGVGISVAFTLAAGTAYQAGAGNWTTGAALATTNQTNFLASAGHTIRLTGFYLTDGISKIPVQLRTIEEEMDRCRRQLYVLGGGANSVVMGSGVMTNASAADALVIDLPTTMRIAPSHSTSAAVAVALYDGTTIQNATITTSGGISDGKWSGVGSAAAATFVAGRVAVMVLSAGQKFIIKAEL